MCILNNIFSFQDFIINLVTTKELLKLVESADRQQNNLSS